MRSNQSLRSKLHQSLSQDNSELDNIIRTDLLKVVKNTIVFENSVYQISNICTIELADLSRMKAVDIAVPAWYFVLLVLGSVLIFFYYFGAVAPIVGSVGILMLVLASYLFWRHSKLDRFKKEEKYGLKIGMNSAKEVILFSRDRDFVLRVILTLYKIMNSEKPESVSINFTTNTVEDRSINIGQAYGSAVVSGKVVGDVVGNV